MGADIGWCLGGVQDDDGEEAAAELQQQADQAQPNDAAAAALVGVQQDQHAPHLPAQPDQQQDENGPLRDRVRRASSLMVHFDGHRST